MWFRYPERKEEFVLKGLNLEINPQDSVALVGESGSGKSTFVKLMMRFYEPQSGEILLDGVPIQNYNLHELRKAISLVMQEPIIFNYSIQENMLYGKLDASNEEIYASSDRANCNDFIVHMEERKIKDLEPKEIIKQMEANKDGLLKTMTEKEYKEDLKEVKALDAVLEKKGKFEYLKGDVDRR